MKTTLCLLLASVAVAWAQPALTPQQRAKLSKSPIPVMVPGYLPSGYELREVLAGPENSSCYQLTYAQKGKQAIGMYAFFITGSDRSSWRKSAPSGEGVKSYVVKHPSLGLTKLWFQPEKMRGGPLGLYPRLKGQGQAFYDLEGNLEPKEAIKVLESLHRLPSP
ncbi:MAG: hypothetical protein U0931_40915 [Vulcanimicrobiota bacterium]